MVGRCPDLSLEHSFYFSDVCATGCSSDDTTPSTPSPSVTWIHRRGSESHVDTSCPIQLWNTEVCVHACVSVCRRADACVCECVCVKICLCPWECEELRGASLVLPMTRVETLPGTPVPASTPSSMSRTPTLPVFSTPGKPPWEACHSALFT